MRSSLLIVLAVLASGCAGMRIRPPKVQAPEGTTPVEVLSSNPGREWDVVVGPERVCTSPCKGFAEHGRDIVLLSGEDRIWLVGGVDTYRELGPIRIRAVPSHEGAFVTGVTFTSLGGMTLFTGGFLALAGGLGERPDVTTAGMITAGAGMAVTLVGLVTLFSSFPHPEFYAFDGDRPVRLVFGPGMVTADF